MPSEAVVYKGLEGIYVKETQICYIDGEQGKLYYRGYPIEVLAEKSTYEEVVYLLLRGRLPTRRELEELESQMKRSRELPKEAVEVIKLFPKDAHPMDVLRTLVSYMASLDPELFDGSKEANIRKAVRIISFVPTVVAYFDRIRKGREPVSPDPELSHAANFLYMLRGEKPGEEEARLMDVALILHAEHGMNASAFSCMVTASTLADLYSAITAGIGTLRGPLHGGANERVLKMIMEVGSPEKAEEYVSNLLAQKKRLMGFGHRVYKYFDPRYRILKAAASGVAEKKGYKRLFETAEAIEKVAVEKLAEKRIFPNVDYYSGLVYISLGIDLDLFTPIFAISRTVGWAAHVIEYLEENRLIRPRALYVGELDREYVPIDERG